MIELIVLPIDKCSRCGSEQGQIAKQAPPNLEIIFNFLCPNCRQPFCIDCMLPDYGGPGYYILCPNCHSKLYFPESEI